MPYPDDGDLPVEAELVEDGTWLSIRFPADWTISDDGVFSPAISPTEARAFALLVMLLADRAEASMGTV